MGKEAKKAVCVCVISDSKLLQKTLDVDYIFSFYRELKSAIVIVQMSKNIDITHNRKLHA